MIRVIGYSSYDLSHMALAISCLGLGNVIVMMVVKLHLLPNYFTPVIADAFPSIKWSKLKFRAADTLIFSDTDSDIFSYLCES